MCYGVRVCVCVCVSVCVCEREELEEHKWMNVREYVHVWVLISRVRERDTLIECVCVS